MKIEDLIKVPFEEAIKAFQEIVVLSPEEYSQLEAECKSKAFTVTGVSKLDILNDVHKELNKVLEEGTALKEFQKNIDKLFVKKGWTKEDRPTPWRVNNIYRTNTQKLFQAGRYKQQTDPDIVERRPYWQYDAINDSKTRPSHKRLDGVVKRYDDPFWDTYYPCNGFQCRCSVRSRSERDIKRLGLKVTDYNIGVRPDIGWDVNPAKEIWQPDLSKYPQKLRDKFTKEGGEKE